MLKKSDNNDIKIFKHLNNKLIFKNSCLLGIVNFCQHNRDTPKALTFFAT